MVRKIPKLKVLRNSENYGLSGSHKVAFNYSIENEFDYVIVLHGDDQGDIHDLLQVVQSNDWNRFRPTYLLVEANSNMSLTEIEKLEMSIYLQSVGYELYGRFYNTLLWRNQWLDRQA